jgi:hypothetical protein
MSKKKLAGIIVACVAVIIVVTVIIIPSLTPSPEPAEFRVSNLHVSPDEVGPGETVTVTVEVQNVGEEQGTHQLELIIDGLVEQSESVTLDGGAATTITFTLQKERDKVYSVETDGLSGSFEVIIPATKVGGIINEDTTWTEEDSPYEITKTVQIPDGITLTIEPGVVVRSEWVGAMFLLNGKIYAHGTLEKKIVFDGGGDNSFFSAQNRNPYIGAAFADLEYCIIRNGGPFWPNDGRGYFWLRYSELSDLYGESWIWYEHEDVYIEYNRFTEFGGFRVNNSNRNFNPSLPSATVYIRYNLFDGKSNNYLIFNEVSDGGSVIVSYNSFINMTGIVLRQGNYVSPNMSAPHDYWGTDDMESIEAMIYDKNDDINCPGYISYLPILTEPHPATPIP